MPPVRAELNVRHQDSHFAKATTLSRGRSATRPSTSSTAAMCRSSGRECPAATAARHGAVSGTIGQATHQRVREAFDRRRITRGEAAVHAVGQPFRNHARNNTEGAIACNRRSKSGSISRQRTLRQGTREGYSSWWGPDNAPGFVYCVNRDTHFCSIWTQRGRMEDCGLPGPSTKS